MPRLPITAVLNTVLVGIDPVRLADVRASTEKSAAILGEIFGDEDADILDDMIADERSANSFILA